MKSEYKNQLVIGRKPVLELINSGKQIEKIFIQQGLKGEFEIELRNILKGKNIPVSFVHPNKLKAFTNQNHQGIIAISALIDYWKIEDLIDDIYFKGEVPNLIMLDSITDVRNVGSIIRSAEVLGSHGLIMGIKNSAAINHTTIKTSAGAVFNIPISKVKSLSNTIDFLKNNGIKIFTSNLKAKKKINQIDFTGPCCTVLGSEDEGVSNHISKNADDEFIIPQKGKTDSLNVGVSAGIILYEILSQREK
ncbi:MAG TPA: 23S rRNA (guanosine(2251)-2'-O)-methyltransferase RlmB [Bacteroidetes bacterium]|nr:23S rRNA (guanosine(2251)-2'-O)-methyltransferase RlmB [Bacteroidota bacterium]